MKRLILALLLTVLFASAAPAQFFGSGSGGGSSNGTVTVTDNSNLVLVTGRLTSAQIKALVGTPVTVVSAAGANTTIDPISMCVVYNFGTTQYATGTGALTLRYNSAPSIFTTVMSSANLLGSVNAYACPTMTVTDPITTDVNNKDLQFIFSGGSEYTAGDGTISYEIIYRVVTTNH